MKVNLPAGLVDSSLEIFRDENRAATICHGKQVDYLELNSSMREPFQAELIANKKAIAILQSHFRLTGADEMEEQYVLCRYGGLNYTPDLKDGETKADLPVCNNIDSCPGFGVLCKAPEGPAGTLTRREYQVAVLVAAGKLNKEIASELNIEITTVCTYHERIHAKLCVNNRIEIALWLHKQGIL